MNLTFNTYKAYKQVNASIKNISNDNFCSDESVIELSGYSKPISVRKTQCTKLKKWYNTGKTTMPNRVRATINETRDNDTGKVLKAELVYFETLGVKQIV